MKEAEIFELIDIEKEDTIMDLREHDAAIAKLISGVLIIKFRQAGYSNFIDFNQSEIEKRTYEITKEVFGEIRNISKHPIRLTADEERAAVVAINAHINIWLFTDF